MTSGAILHLSGAMATGADVRDILELGGPEGDAASGTISKKDIINPDKVAGAPENLGFGSEVVGRSDSGREMGEMVGCCTSSEMGGKRCDIGVREYVLP